MLYKFLKIRVLFASLTISLTLLGIGLIVLCQRAANQSQVVDELLTLNHVAVQFSDGTYFASSGGMENRNHYLESVDVVYVNVLEGGESDIVPLLRQLPSLSRVIVRYQGDNFSEFQKRQEEINQAIENQKAEIQRALPDIEVLKFSVNVEYRSVAKN